MVSFRVEVQGLDSLLGQLDSLPADMEPAITRALVTAASEAVEQIQSLISDSFPPESLPFTPPHVRTGALRRSVRIDRVEPLAVTLGVGGRGTLVNYAAWLEFGTSKMTPRPFVMPVVERVMPGIPSIVLEEVNRELERQL